MGGLQIKSKVSSPQEEVGIIAALTHFVDTLNPRLENGLYQRIKNDYPEMQSTLEIAHINAGQILNTFKDAKTFEARKKDIGPNAIKEAEAEKTRNCAGLAKIEERAAAMFDALAALERHASEVFKITQGSLAAARPDGFTQRATGAITQTTLGDELRPEVRRTFTSDFEYLQAVRDLELFRTGEVKTSAISMRPMVIDMGKKLAARAQGQTPD